METRTLARPYFWVENVLRVRKSQKNILEANPPPHTELPTKKTKRRLQLPGDGQAAADLQTALEPERGRAEEAQAPALLGKLRTSGHWD